MQLWDAFRQQHLKLHRKLGYLAVAATALGSLSGAPYAVSYLFSSHLPEQVSWCTAVYHMRFCKLDAFAPIHACLLRRLLACLTRC